MSAVTTAAAQTWVNDEDDSAGQGPKSNLRRIWANAKGASAGGVQCVLGTAVEASYAQQQCRSK